MPSTSTGTRPIEGTTNISRRREQSVAARRTRCSLRVSASRAGEESFRGQSWRASGQWASVTTFSSPTGPAIDFARASPSPFSSSYSMTAMRHIFQAVATTRTESTIGTPSVILASMNSCTALCRRTTGCPVESVRSSRLIGKTMAMARRLDWLRLWYTYFQAVGYVEMSSHRFLSDDRTLQRVEYANGVAVEFDLNEGRFRVQGIDGIAEDWQRPPTIEPITDS